MRTEVKSVKNEMTQRTFVTITADLDAPCGAKYQADAAAKKELLLGMLTDINRWDVTDAFETFARSDIHPNVHAGKFIGFVILLTGESFALYTDANFQDRIYYCPVELMVSGRHLRFWKQGVITNDECFLDLQEWNDAILDNSISTLRKYVRRYNEMIESAMVNNAALEKFCNKLNGNKDLAKQYLHRRVRYWIHAEYLG